MEIGKLGGNSVDSIVTDPPYELGFMGKRWDKSGIAYSVEMWEGCLRVLKPGGHLLSFGGSRTYHRMACAIEDAGFEIRDCLMYVYGSGFPKSLDVSKAMDKKAGAVGVKVDYIAPDGKKRWGGNTFSIGEAPDGRGINKRTIPTTDAAIQWQGWGTALKPAYEPICMARKPLEGTVVENVQKWGTGAINVDGCRVGTSDTIEQSGELQDMARSTIHSGYDRPNATMFRTGKPKERSGPSNKLGRWPANLIHDGSEEVLELFPEMKSGGANGNRKNGPYSNDRTWSVSQTPGADVCNRLPASSGSAARFFYCAKASRAEREMGLEGMNKKPLHWSSGHQNPGNFQSPNTDKSAKNNHPTVKPLTLMRYLCRLVTPPHGLVLDPFMGSGTTGIACRAEGFNFIGIELNPKYCEMAKKRIYGELEEATA